MSQIGCLLMVAKYNPQVYESDRLLADVVNYNPQVYESDRLLADGC